MKVYELVDSHLKAIERRIPWLSKRIGISESALRAVRYDDRRQYTLETMVKIAIALDMDLNELKKIDWDNQEQGGKHGN